MMIVALCFLGGCINDTRVVEEARQTHVQISATLKILEDAKADMLASIEEIKDKEEKQAALSQVNKISAKIDQFRLRLDGVDKLIQKAETNSDLAEGVARGTAPFLPPPWNLIVLGGASVLATLRAASNKSKAKKIVDAIEVVKNNNTLSGGAGSVDFSSTQTKEALRSLMGESTTAWVDTLKKGGKIPF